VTEQEAYILNHEESVEHSDGTITWLRTNKLPLYDRNGKVFGYSGHTKI